MSVSTLTFFGIVMYFLFFFSSRRRHTRFDCDWSSDVCSSDLYAARGDPELAARVQRLLAPLAVAADHSWGLDHGSWSVLKHVFPDASVPVVQLSIDETRAADFHYELGARLRPLRDEGVLILGSGDIVHNLHAYAWGGHPREPYDWATRFEARVRERLEAGDHAPLVDYGSLGQDAPLSLPTPQHYPPPPYRLRAGFPREPLPFPGEGGGGGPGSLPAGRSRL